MLMNTTFLEDSFLIKWQSRGITQQTEKGKKGYSIKRKICPDFATCFILTIEKNVENTALGLYFL